MDRVELQEDNLRILVRNGGFQFSDTFFPYTSGQIGPYYVNSESVMKTSGDYFLAVKYFADLINSVINKWEFDVISGGESRDWIFSNEVALRLGKSSVMIYKDRKIIPHVDDLRGKRVVHVADLNNEGSSPRDIWIPALRNAGATVKNILFYVDRLEDGVGVMKSLELRSEAVVPLNEHAWNYLKQQDVLNEQIYKNLRERMEDKDAWARAMLRSEKGFARFRELINNSKTYVKAIKVIEVGYPDLKQEIMDRLGRS